jgi:hypothetical protein
LALAAALALGGRAGAQDAVSFESSPLVESPACANAWEGWTDPGDLCWMQPPAPEHWTLDYRCRAFIDSYTQYEFGTPPEMTPGWTPLSRLNFSLNSVWHGLELAKVTPKSSLRFEWLMAGQYIENGLSDYDWVPPNPDGSFTHLGYSRERFTEGQMLDLGYKYKIVESNLVEVWPMVGFRWQRFDITCFDAVQVKYDNVWLDPPFYVPGDVITFNQQYWVGYVGAQVCGKLQWGNLRPLAWTVQADWGQTEAYNVDHHLVREGDMYGMDRTHGSAWHAAITLEALVTDRIGLGIQADYVQIDTTGEHRDLNEPFGFDETWGYGVSVVSRQTWLTGFLRVRM